MAILSWACAADCPSLAATASAAKLERATHRSRRFMGFMLRILLRPRSSPCAWSRTRHRRRRLPRLPRPRLSHPTSRSHRVPAAASRRHPSTLVLRMALRLESRHPRCRAQGSGTAVANAAPADVADTFSAGASSWTREHEAAPHFAQQTPRTLGRRKRQPDPRYRYSRHALPQRRRGCNLASRPSPVARPYAHPPSHPASIRSSASRRNKCFERRRS
jgi:hypothetical protein